MPPAAPVISTRSSLFPFRQSLINKSTRRSISLTICGDKTTTTLRNEARGGIAPDRMSVAAAKLDDRGPRVCADHLLTVNIRRGWNAEQERRVHRTFFRAITAAVVLI